MGSERIVRRQRLRDHVGILRLDPIVDVLAVVAEWPSIEGSVTQARHVIGGKMVAQFIAFVDGHQSTPLSGSKARPTGLRNPEA